MLNKLLHSRRFWIAIVAIAVNIAAAAFPQAQYKPAIDALNQFAMFLISAYTLEDSAAAFNEGRPVARRGV